MAKKQITISVDEQWLDAIDRNANPGFCLVHTLESLVVDFVAKVLVPDAERTAVSRAIANENHSRSASIIAANAVAEKPKYNIITVIEKGTSPSFMVWDEGLSPIIEKVRDYPRVKDHLTSWTFCDMFPGKLIRQKNESFDSKVAEYLFHPNSSDVACIYSVDLDRRRLGILKKWTGTKSQRAFAYWRFFDLDKLFTLQDEDPEGVFEGFPEMIWHFLDDVDLHLPIREIPDIYISGLKPLSEKDVQFEDEIYQEHNLLSFFMGTAFFDPDALFGTFVCTTENDDIVNAYAYFDLDKDDVVDELSVVVSPAAAFPDEVYKYRLTQEEKALLRREMDAYLKAPDSQGHTTTLSQLRAEYINEKGKEKNRDERTAVWQNGL